MRTSCIALTLWATLAGGSALAQPAWQTVTTVPIEREKAGFFNKLCGVAVDPASGDVLVNLSEKGFYRSTDQGKTWTHTGGKPIKGRTETPGCLMLDPFGKSKKIVSALVYGSPIVVSADGGASWKTMHNQSSHVDWFAVDWTDPDMKFVLTLKHEKADLLLVSRDGGQSFDEVGKGYGPAWIFDGKTAVVAEAKSKTRPKPRILRTTDGAKTFEPCGDYHAKALPRWKDGVLYWVVDGAVIATKDEGKSWQKLSDLKDGRFGPVFGKDAKHMFVLTGSGVVESTDSGATWSKAIPAPKEMKGISSLSWLAYDPVHDVLYLMRMTSELYRLNRKG